MSTLLTVPMLGWVAKDSPQSHPFACGFKVSKYGPQTATDPYDPDCGNGVFTGTAPTNDPTDTSIAADPATWDGAWVSHNITAYGNASAGGVKFYELDNEPSLWSSTHRDVHPLKVSDDELTNRSIPTARAIKAADRTAQVMGPSEWGYLAYLQSAVGDESGTHGGLNYTQWYLQQMAAASTQSGHRLLDYLDEHYYPQNAGVALSPAGSPDTQTVRLRSTRSLWDPTYTDESWQSYLGPLEAIPRLTGWIAA
jgi:Glycoside hydrolase family 44